MKGLIRAFFLVTACLSGCGTPTVQIGGGSARLTARPGTPTATITPGTTKLGDPNSPDGYLVVPSSYDPARPLPLVLALHGAGGKASGPLNFLGPYAESHNFILLAVSSRGLTWDAIRGQYGPDVAFIDQSLRFAFERCAVDPTRVIVEGFSDGATYALGLGLGNGDLFSRVVAFSPGFIPNSDSPWVGKPEFFISHGRQDQILPIGATSQQIVVLLQAENYTVTFVQFDGGHEVPDDVALQAVVWMTRP